MPRNITIIRLLAGGACLLLAGSILAGWGLDGVATWSAAAEPVSGDAGRESGKPPPTAGSIAVTVTYTGKVPRARVPDEAGHRHELLSVDRKSKGVRYVLAYLGDAPASAPDPKSDRLADSDESNNGDSDEIVTVDQIEHQFVPRLVAVRADSPVVFTNSDPANHSVRATSFVAENNFSVFVPFQGEYQHRFGTDRKDRPVLVSCDIHPWMKAWIYVFDHPHFAVSGAYGKLRIEAVPPGKHRLEIRQPDIGYRAVRDVEVIAGETTRIELRLTEEDVRSE